MWSRANSLKLMKPEAVLVDVSIDQGGCFETSRPTNALGPDVRGRRHHPLLRREHAGRGPDHIHLCAHERDAAVCVDLATAGIDEALERSPSLRAGLNVDRGAITHPAVAEALGIGAAAS